MQFFCNSDHPASALDPLEPPRWHAKIVFVAN